MEGRFENHANNMKVMIKGEVDDGGLQVFADQIDGIFEDEIVVKNSDGRAINFLNIVLGCLFEVENFFDGTLTA